MRNRQFASVKYVVVFAALILFSACSSDDSQESKSNSLPGVRPAGSGSALSLPRSIVVGQANINAPASAQNSASLIQPAAATDAGTDYSTDPVLEGNLADSNIAMAFVNTMLCLIDETHAVDQVNQGPYLATVPYNICNQMQDATNAGVMIELTINSSRKDDESPQYIQLWFSDNTTAGPFKAVVEFVIYNKVSNQYPFGLFDVNYLVYSAASVDAPLQEWKIAERASIRSKMSAASLPRFEFLLSGGAIPDDPTFNVDLRSITQITSADSQNGQSRFSLNIGGSFPYEETTNSIFNADYNLEINAGSSTSTSPSNGTGTSPTPGSCYSRNDTIAAVWAYNLYDAVTGARIPMQATPIAFNYTHLAQNDRFNTDPNTNTSIGADYTLSYRGPGMLSFANIDGSYASPNLVDGTVLTDANGTDYWVKAMEIIYSPASVPIDACAMLDTTIPANNPDLNLDTIPVIESPGAVLTDWPSL